MRGKEEELSLISLLKAAYECAKGVKWKESIARWIHPRNIMENISKLFDQIIHGRYRLGGYTIFEVTEPKRRTIRSPKFRDRVVQRAMCNEGLYFDLTHSNIYDNAACQKDKGTTFAANRLERFLHEIYCSKTYLTAWVLKLDIHHFFDSIPHSQLHEMVDRKVRNIHDKRRVHEIINSFKGDKGIGLGSQISQLLAISYLSDLDHEIKEDMKIKYYVRYSDDMVLIDADKEKLKEVKKKIEKRLEKLGLELNPKSGMFPLRQGVNFLKFKFYLTDSGKVIKRLSKKNFYHEKKKLSKLISKVDRGEMEVQDVWNSFISWKSHAEQGNSNFLVWRMKKWLENQLSLHLNKQEKTDSEELLKPQAED